MFTYLLNGSNQNTQKVFKCLYIYSLGIIKILSKYLNVYIFTL